MLHPHLAACLPAACLPPQPPSNAYGKLVEGEGHDRTSLKLLDTQEKLWKVRAGTLGKRWVELCQELQRNTHRVVESCSHLTACLCAASTAAPQRVAERSTKPLVVVLVHGGPLDVSELAASPRVRALLTLWYPGQAGSAALGDILAGKVSPSGARCCW